LIGFAAEWNTFLISLRNLEGEDGFPDGNVVRAFPVPREDVPWDAMIRDRSGDVQSALSRDSMRTRNASRSSSPTLSESLIAAAIYIPSGAVIVGGLSIRALFIVHCSSRDFSPYLPMR
jgi:hypothetical protein